MLFLCKYTKLTDNSYFLLKPIDILTDIGYNIITVKQTHKNQKGRRKRCPDNERIDNMLYNVEIHEWNESTPDDGIWQGDIFPDLTEADSEAEAIRLCIDYYMEEADWSTTDHDPDSVTVKADCIEYVDGNGNRCEIQFRAERTIVNNLKALRKKAGMTQQELADKTGLTFQKISMYENTDDLRNITLWNALRIAEALGVTIEDITLKQI